MWAVLKLARLHVSTQEQNFPLRGAHPVLTHTHTQLGRVTFLKKKKQKTKLAFNEFLDAALRLHEQREQPGSGPAAVVGDAGRSLRLLMPSRLEL